MNKNKLVNLATEVLTDIDEGLKDDLIKELERKLLQRLEYRFYRARYYLSDSRKDWKEEYTTYTNGGCIIVPSKLIKEFVKRIKQALKLMIDSGYVVDDQRIYDWIAFNTDGLVAYQQCDWRKYTEHYN